MGEAQCAEIRSAPGSAPQHMGQEVGAGPIAPGSADQNGRHRRIKVLGAYRSMGQSSQADPNGRSRVGSAGHLPTGQRQVRHGQQGGAQVALGRQVERRRRQVAPPRQRRQRVVGGGSGGTRQVGRAEG